LTGLSRIHFGKTGYPGVAMAPAFIWRRAIVEIPVEMAQDRAAEQQRFLSARAAVQKRLENLAQDSNQNSESREILEAHIMMLNDPEWESQVMAKIENGHNVFKSVQEAGLEFKAMLESLDDEYLRARGQDIMDLTQQILIELSGEHEAALEPNDNYLLFADDLLPSEFLKLKRELISGIVLENSSTTSHTAILAKTFEIPLIVGAREITQRARAGLLAAINSIKGQIIFEPEPHEQAEFQQQVLDQQGERNALMKLVNQLSISRDGHRFEVASNLSSIIDAELAHAKGSEGCGLFRSEFLLMDRSTWPSEDEQVQVYSQIIKRMSPHRTIIRLFDIGGDKTLPYFQTPKEENPFLGVRGLRLLLQHPEKLKSQLRAIGRASHLGPVGVMAPMVTTPDEFREFKRLAYECLHENKVELGIMVEVPAIALGLRDLAHELDFISVGTNDLIQYLCATDRMNSAVAHLHDPYHPAVLRFLKLIADQLSGTKVWMGLCGELAAQPSYVPLLMALGFKELSVSPGALLKTRAMVRATSVLEAHSWLQQALECQTSSELREFLDARRIGFEALFTQPV